MRTYARCFAWVMPLAGFLLPFALWTVLASAWGRDRLRSELVDAVNDSVQGTLAVGSVRVGPGLTLSIRGVRLTTPEGDRALEAHRARATVSVEALVRGRVEVELVTERPLVDLTPDEAGQPALLRALAPHEEQEEAEKAGRQLALRVLVRDGRVVREAARALDIGEIDFELGFDAKGDRSTITIEGTAMLERPARMPLKLFAEIERAGTAIIVKNGSALAGRSPIAITNARWTGDPGTLGGSLLAIVQPADVHAFVPSLSPAAPIALEANATPIEGVLHAEATARVAGGGDLSITGRREVDGTVHSWATMTSVVPARWGWPRELRDVRIDHFAIALDRTPDGALDFTLSRAEARDEDGPWRLEGPAAITKRGEVVRAQRIEISGPWGQRILAEGRWPPLANEPLLVEARNLALHGLPGRIAPSLAPLAGFVDARLTLTARDEGAARLAVRDGSWRAKGPVDVHASAALANGRIRAKANARTWRGERVKIVADAPLRVPREADHVFVNAIATGLDAGQLSDISAVATAGIDGGRTWISAQAADHGRVLFRIAGSTSADWASMKGLDVATLLERLPPSAVTFADLDLAALAAAGLLPAGTDGTVGGIAAIVDGQLSAHVTSAGTRAGPMQGLTVSTGIRKSRNAAIVSALVSDESGGAAAAGVFASFHTRELLAGKLDSLRWIARAAVSDLGIGEATGGERAPALLGAQPAFSGRLDAAIAIDGRSIHPRGWLWARAPDLRVREKRFGSVLLASRIADDGVAAWLSTAPVSGGKLAAVTRVTGDPRRWLTVTGSWRTAPLFAAVVAEDLSLSPYGDFLERVRHVEGNLDARAVLRGTPGKPEPIARAAVTNGSLSTTEIGRVRDIELIANADSRKIHLEKLSARGSRGGALAGSAVATLSKKKKWLLNGGLVSKNFSVRGDRFAGEIDGRAKLAGDLEYPNLNATIEVDSAVVFLPQQSDPDLQPLAPHPDVVVLSTQDEIRRVSGRDGSVKPKELIATLRVLFPRDVWIRGKDVNIEIKGDVTIRTGGREPALAGEIVALRGRADVMGKKFVLDHARIGFIGAPARKARLDVLATHTMEDVEKTVVHAKVAGTIEEPKITLTSEPPLPEDAVASLLVLGTADPRGRPGGQESPSLAGRAATFVGNYLTKELRDEVQEIVPVDVFELEPGSAGSASEGRLRVGKYVAPGLFLSYAHAFGAAPDEGANALRLEYRFHNAWYLISEFTDGSRGDIDLVWTREF